VHTALVRQAASSVAGTYPAGFFLAEESKIMEGKFLYLFRW